MSQTLLDNKYNSSKVENRWYKHWLEKNYFHADAESKKEPYTIVIPRIPIVKARLRIIFIRDSNIKPNMVSIKGYIHPYAGMLFASGSYIENEFGKFL